jgi:outer membrane lipoprotein-sorting protein
MLRRPLTRLTTLIAVIALAGPASAQGANPLDWLFGRKAAPPAPAETAAPASPAMPATAVLPPKRPASLPTAGDAASAQPNAAAAQTAPSQPQAPARPSPVAATASISPAALNEPLSERQIVERANAYFNGMSTLTGDFVQTGGDGRRLTGKLYLQRPGRIRFEYDAPATIEVIADGSSVAVRDSKLVTQDLYAISQTPLKFLLRDHIDLGQDIRIVGVSLEPEGARVLLEDKSTLGGTSKIALFFDKDVRTLQHWRIVDPQGFTTIVALSNLDTARRVDPRLFVINYERMLEDKR